MGWWANRQAAKRLLADGMIQSYTEVGPPPQVEAGELVTPIVQQLALLGPAGWERFDAVFSATVSAELVRLVFRAGRESVQVPVPLSIAELGRRHRELAAQMPAGPWFRMLLEVTNTGQTSVSYDYGDERLPDDDLFPPQHYRDDLAAHPRPDVPAWLSAYIS